jgi:valyl-tRNA synthetase
MGNPAQCKINSNPMQQQEPTIARDERYNAQQIEEKWSARWQQDASLFAAEKDSAKTKYYVLEMLPYPPEPCTWGTCGTTP